MMNERVQLNVGGSHFETTRATLTSCPDSLLARMFDPDSELLPAAVTEDGAFFLDACHRAFTVILNWLRYKEILLGKEVTSKDVIPVADYFGLTELSAKLDNVSDTIRLNVGGTIFETTRGTLTQKPGTKLAGMFTPFSRTSPPVTPDGSYFIDASPRAFEIVLDWLRWRRMNENNYSYQNIVPIDYQVALAAESIGIRVVGISSLDFI